MIIVHPLSNHPPQLALNIYRISSVRPGPAPDHCEIFLSPPCMDVPIPLQVQESFEEVLDLTRKQPPV